MKYFLLLFLIFINPMLAQSENFRKDPARLSQAALNIDKKCHEELGINIAALAILLDANPGMFYLAGPLNTEGKMNLVLELENAGYVKIKKIDSAEGQTIELIRTEIGNEIVKSLKH